MFKIPWQCTKLFTVHLSASEHAPGLAPFPLPRGLSGELWTTAHTGWMIPHLKQSLSVPDERSMSTSDEECWASRLVANVDSGRAGKIKIDRMSGFQKTDIDGVAMPAAQHHCVR